jgi:uridine kinase
VNRADLLRELERIILDRALPHPTRVAIDGVDAAGKTTLASEIAAVLKTCARQVVRASIDGFHNPKHVRRRDDSAEGYFRSSFNYQALVDNLLTPLGPNGSRLFRRATFDFRADAAVVSERELAALDAILLFDGVFLLRSELRTHWDLSIFVHADFERRLPERKSEIANCLAMRVPFANATNQDMSLANASILNRSNRDVSHNDFNDPRLECAAQPSLNRIARQRHWRAIRSQPASFVR